MRKEAKSAVAALRNATAELAAGLDGIRQRIDKITDERSQVVNANIPKKDALARLDTWAERARSGGIPELPISGFVTPAGRGNPEFTQDSPIKFEVVLSGIADTMRDRLAGRIEEAYDDGDGTTDEERQHQLQKLDVELGDLELAEEAIIRDAELSSIPLLRRADASPEIVLADDSEMPI